MSWKTLRPQIVDLLNDTEEIQDTKSYPTLGFSGYPAAYVVPSDNSADYETTDENIRTYAFIIRVFYETKESGVEDGLSGLEGIVDSVLDLFDNEDQKGADSRKVGINLPSSYTFLNIWATPAQWGEVEGENLLMAELRVGVRISVDVS